MYVPLWCKTNFSFLEGASHPEELVAEARQLGLPALAITDRDGVHGVVRAHVAARENGLKLLIGAQVSVTAHLPRGKPPRGAQGELGIDDVAATPVETPVLLAMDRVGYGNLCRLLSLGRRRCEKGASLVTWTEVAEWSAGLLLLCHQAGALLEPSLPRQEPPKSRRRAVRAEKGAPASDVAPALPDNVRQLQPAGAAPESDPRVLRLVAEAFGDRAYGLVTRHRRAEEVPAEQALRRRMATLGWPLVAGSEVLYHSPARRPLQDVLTCIRHGTSLQAAGQLLRANAEHGLLAPHAFGRLFADEPDLVARTLALAERCRFSLGELRYRYPAHRLPDGTTQSEWLRELVFRGAADRYRGVPPDDVVAQIDKELALIEQLDYGGYFLSMWEIVQFCREQGILCQGRGSAANSVVCYCLGITAIDPVRMGLLFERFLSLERAEPPDIDLDIEHERREEVIQHVYRRYDPQHRGVEARGQDAFPDGARSGRARSTSRDSQMGPDRDPQLEFAPCVVDPARSHAAMVANVIRYRTRSAVRDVGKALGIPETALDRVARLAPHYSDGIDDDTLRTCGLDPDNPTQSLLVQLTQEIQDFPRHLSIHPGGFLLGHEPVDSLVPIENATMVGRTVIQWDKDDVEALGLFKVDLLGLGMLSQIHRCFDLLRAHRGLELTMATVPAEDADVYAMVSRGDTVGVFQIESRAQMSMLPRLKPRTFYDLVIEVAIIRPGPITGGMVHPYLRRRDGLEPVEYPHECLLPVLEKTLGIPLFQEQVMKLAVVAADYTPGEADRLRRDMAAWKKSGRIEAHRDRLVQRMVAKGIAVEFAARVFEQIRGFGEYGFPESHAASFALISYVTAWLKCHHPAEFVCALLNAWPMGFYTPATLVEDARRHGVEVRPVDVQASAWECTLEPIEGSGATGARPFPDGPRLGMTGRADPDPKLPFAVRMGLRFVKGLGVVQQNRLEAAPAPYADLDDFARRTVLDRASLDALAEAGAFDSFGLDRRSALWQVRALAQRAHEPLALHQHEDLPLFQSLGSHDQVLWDYRRTSHSARGHPLEHLRGELRARGLPSAVEVNRLSDGRRLRFAGLVICRQRPGTAKGVTFFTLEDETGFVNLVIWRDVYEKFSVLARTAALVGVSGKVQSQSGVVHVVVEALWPLELERPVAGAGSRDFR